MLAGQEPGSESPREAALQFRRDSLVARGACTAPRVTTVQADRARPSGRVTRGWCFREESEAREEEQWPHLTQRPTTFFFTALSSPWIPTCWSRAWLARPLWILWLAFLPHHVHYCFWSHSVTQVQRQLSKNTLDANSERLTIHGWGGSDVHHERGIHINGWRGKTPPQWLIGWWSSKPTTGFCFLSEFLASIETSCSYPYFICIITSLTWFPPCLLAYIFEWCALKLFILI